jgi:hypothetical protein
MKKIVILKNNRKNRRFATECLFSKNVKFIKKTKNVEIILVSLIPTAVHQMIATLDMPTGKGQRSARATIISAAAGGSTFLTIPPATITALNNLITLYTNSTTAGRKSAYNKLSKALKALMATFQTAGDLNPDTAEALIKSGGFGVKKVAIKQKQIFGAKNGPDSGSILLVAQGGGNYSCHDWMISLDGIHFTRMAPTVAGNTKATGLTPLTWAWFTHELVTKKGGQGISQIIKIQVK